EAKRSFPLLATYAAEDIDAIEATSRRGFAREAAKLNDKYTRVLGPALKDLAAAKALAKTDAQAEARTMAQNQWGVPVAEAGGAAETSTQQRALDEARANRAPLIDRIK